MKKLLDKFSQFSFFKSLKHTSIYFSGTMLNQVLGLVSLPVFTYFMTPGEYGIAGVYISYFTVLGVLLTLNMHLSIKRYYFEKGVNLEEFKEFLGSIFSVTLIIYAVFSFLMLFFQDAIAYQTSLPKETIPWLIYFPLALFFSGIFNQLHIALGKSKLVATGQVIMQYLRFGAAVIGFLLVTENFYMGKIIGEFFGASVVCVFMCYKVWPYITFKGIQKRHLIYSLKFSLPLVPYALGGYIINSFDQWYIISKLGAAPAGLYSFAYKLGMLLLGLYVALDNAMYPDYNNLMNEGNHEKVSAQAIFMAKVLMIGAAFLAFFAIDLGTLLSAKEDFKKALPFVPVIVFGYVFFGLAAILNRGILYLKQNMYLLVITMITGAVNIVLNIYFIQEMEDYGLAAYTTLASYIVMFLLSIILTQFIMKLPRLPVIQMIAYGIPFAVITFIFYWFGLDKVGLDPVNIIIKGVLFLTLAGLFFGQTALKLLRKSD